MLAFRHFPWWLCWQGPGCAHAFPIDPENALLALVIESMLADAELDREYKRPWGDVAKLGTFLRDVLEGIQRRVAMFSCRHDAVSHA